MATIKVKLFFTGICTYSPGTPPADGQKHPKVIFVIPFANTWKKSKKKPGKVIPPHVPFLMAPEVDVAREADGDWVGRAPDGRIRNHVFWILGRENVRFKDLDTDGVEYGDMSDVIHIPDLCKDAGMDSSLLNQRSNKVGARIILTTGALSVKSTTDCKYYFELCDGTTTTPAYIADVLQMNLGDVQLSSKGEIFFLTNALDDGPNGEKQIVLKPDKDTAQLELIAGSAPEVDLPAVIGAAPNHQHEDENLHFELHYGVSKKAPSTVIPVPIRVPGSCRTTEGTPPLPGTDTCPPSSNLP